MSDSYNHCETENVHYIYGAAASGTFEDPMSYITLL